MMVLIRWPMPVALATSTASMAKKRIFFSMICSCISRGSRSQTWLLSPGAFSRNTAPGAACSSTSILSTNSNWWQATKRALVTR